MRDAVAFAWRAMDAFFEEDERILGHAADPYHRIDIRRSSRHLVVQDGDQVVADTQTRLLYESGFAPRWYVPRADIVVDALQLVEEQTFCPYKGIASYYNVGDARNAAWSYRAPVEEVEPCRRFPLVLPREADDHDRRREARTCSRARTSSRTAPTAISASTKSAASNSWKTQPQQRREHEPEAPRRSTPSRPSGGDAGIRERRHAERRAVARKDRLPRRLQGARRRPSKRHQAQRRRRRPR